MTLLIPLEVQAKSKCVVPPIEKREAKGSSAQAARFHAERNIDTHQVGYGDVSLAPSGLATITATFSNGKKIAGNKFYAVTGFFDRDDRLIFSYVQWKGLNGSFGGKAREGSVTDRVQLSPAEVRRLCRIKFRFGTRDCGLELISFKKNTLTFSTAECRNAPKRD
ncbi:hypothetical protein [Rhizobium sp. R634]|uniref:hypothetical protein n=1 Tax=Rhizobium sp. R634 TaxID=1764274 RepID=UPI001130579B|nr:hypothetical protein [Rhizobium sp. R634]